MKFIFPATLLLFVSINGFAEEKKTDYGYFSSYKVTIEETKLKCQVYDTVDNEKWKSELLAVKGNEEALNKMTMARVNKDEKTYWSSIKQVKCPDFGSKK